MQFFAASGVAVIMGVALKQAATDQTSVGSFVSFVTAMLMALGAAQAADGRRLLIQRGLAAAGKAVVAAD